MRQEIEEMLREYGWVFAGVSQPDHHRQWAKIKTDENGKFVAVERVENEDYLVELATQLID